MAVTPYTVLRLGFFSQISSDTSFSPLGEASARNIGCEGHFSKPAVESHLLSPAQILQVSPRKAQEMQWEWGYLTKEFPKFFYTPLPKSDLNERTL